MAGTTDIPETRYARLGRDRIAYQVFGEGDLDLVYVPATGDSIENRWDWPSYANYLRRLSSHARIVMFDRRGSGVSDAPSDQSLPAWELWADDARTVLDAVESDRAVIFGHADSGPTAILFAAAHPARTRGLILVNSSARLAAGGENDQGINTETARLLFEAWGTDDALQELSAPELSRDPAFRRWAKRAQRQAIRPQELRELLRSQVSMDVREALPSVRVPTLVLHREGYSLIPPEHAQYLAEHIRGARLAILPGRDGTVFFAPDEQLAHIEEFLKELHETPQPDRALAAILFTDIVGSTARASALGDREWRNLLETHDAVARTVVEQHRGRLVKTTGDGILATFEGPGRAIQCASILAETLRPLGLQMRAGLHTGEVEVRENDIAGIGVHIAARVLEAASPGDLLVSPAVPMLVAGAGFNFDDRGEHELKGVPGTWRLFAVVG
jgi:class 3 adenylate cyclase